MPTGCRAPASGVPDSDACEGYRPSVRSLFRHAIWSWPLAGRQDILWSLSLNKPHLSDNQGGLHYG